MTTQLIPLSGPVGPGQRNKPDDVFLIKAALATLKPTPGQRTFYDDRVDRHYTPKVAVAIRAFQKSRKRPQTGIIQPKDETLNLLTAGIKKYREELKRAPQASLIFDGQALHWVGRPFNGKKWPAVSGSRGFQTWEFQKMMSKGPIPEGTYHVRQLNLQRIDDLPLAKYLYNYFIGLNSWRGGEAAWGRNRIWVRPILGTRAYGRGGFAIHGGAIPGSIGCVDLTRYMPDFVKHFREYGRDMRMLVTYDGQRKMGPPKP